MNRTRVRWDRVAALAAAAVLVVSLGGRALGGAAPSDERSRPQIVVEDGQTLWSIARARVGPEGDPRPLIQDIRDLNAMETSQLEVGQLLVLPGLD